MTKRILYSRVADIAGEIMVEAMCRCDVRPRATAMQRCGGDRSKSGFRSARARVWFARTITADVRTRLSCARFCLLLRVGSEEGGGWRKKGIL